VHSVVHVAFQCEQLGITSPEHLQPWWIPVYHAKFCQESKANSYCTCSREA